MAEDPVNFIHGSGSLGQAYEGHGFMRFRIQSIQPSFFTYQHGSVFLNDVFLETFFIITTRKCYFIHFSTVSHNKNRFFFCGAVSKFEFSLEVDIKIIFSAQAIKCTDNDWELSAPKMHFQLHGKILFSVKRGPSFAGNLTEDQEKG